MAHPNGTDPRPLVEEGSDGRLLVIGQRCRSCGDAGAYTWPRCPACRGEVEPAAYGPLGVVWSSTVVRIAVPGRTAPYVLAYVDLDGGPRVLAHVRVDARETVSPAPIGARVRLAPPSTDGDIQVEVLV